MLAFFTVITAHFVAEIEQALKAEKLTMLKYYWPDSYDARSLNKLLEHTDVLLGIDDSHIYNPSTIKGILLSSYARKQTLIGSYRRLYQSRQLSIHLQQSRRLDTHTQQLTKNATRPTGQAANTQTIIE